jgi:predicted amidohydrolase
MRVAVSQFATSSNIQENLATCVRMINKAAACKPSIIVLPEFCNTLPWYVDHNQAWNEAIAINGPFFKSIAEQAKQHKCYIVFNVTLRRDVIRDHQDGAIKSNISVTSCLLSPLGDLLHQEDKKILTGHEKDFFISANKVLDVISTSFGKLGLLTGNDAASYNASRELSLCGAQLLCNPLSSFALDYRHLHGPARTCDNRVFLASANKVGSLIPEQHSDLFATQSVIDPKVLVGIGQSQIVSPTGKVLAEIAHNEEGVVFADLDLLEANNKLRPDGTELMQQRRPELYKRPSPLTQQVSQYEDNNKVPETANVAIFATYKSNEQAIEDVCHYIVNNLSDIIQLPELFFIVDKAITNNAEELSHVAYLSKQLIIKVSSVLRPFQYVCTSLVIEGMHQAVLISENGLVATQQQLHFCQRYQWTELGDDLNIIKLPLEQGNINVAMLTGDDANIPEIVEVAALNNIHVLLVPFDIQEASEAEYGLLSRAVENRICILAATREKSLTNDADKNQNEKNTGQKKKVKSKKSTGLIVNLTTDFDLLTSWGSHKFSGYINQPLVKHQHGKITKALIHPQAAC